MNNQTILIAVIALLVGGIGGYMVHYQLHSDWAHATKPAGHMNDTMHSGMHQMPDGSMMRNDEQMGAMNGMDHMGMVVSSEREFIVGMIPHHQEAINTAEEVLARGATTPEIQTLAEGIITAQETEIAAMKLWYEEWYGETYTDSGDYQPMMRDLSTLEGAALDRTFLEDMIPHHMGAIMMARSVQPYIEHQEIEELTQAIVSTQSTEIQLMQELLADL